MDAISADALRLITEEAESAQVRYGDFTSTHEALGVLVEEMVELTDAIRANSMCALRVEARQVAAVAGRLYEHARRAVDKQMPEFTKRSGCE